MTSPASLNHFRPPSISPASSTSSNHTTSTHLRCRTIVHVLGVRIPPPSTPIAGATRRRRISIFSPRASDSTVTVDDPIVSSSSSSGTAALGLSPEEEESGAAAEKIGARVRVKVPLKVYHVPKVPEVDLTGMEGVLKQYVGLWKGKRISANLPFKIEFVKEIGGRNVKFFAHLKDDEFEYLD